ncbi:MAG: ATP-binding protein [Pleurocapsa sp. MO_226.B13]|nr:ATP-binding protein [Pleurocapsa sp. MO_226.B13]
MKNLYLLCGMPFSGKTTLSKSVAQYLNAPYISLDEINEARGLFGGEGIPVEEWEKTHYLAMEQLKKIMPFQQDIILDDTNCFRWLRDRFRDLAARYDYQTTLIFLDVSLAEIEKRIAANNRTQTRNKVQPEIIEEMNQTFEPPQADEKSIIYNLKQPINQWITDNFEPSLS